MSERNCEFAGQHRAVAAPAMTGMRLCGSCHARLTSGLAALPGLHERCGRELAGSRYQLLERVTGWSPSGIVLNDAVVAVRSDMAAVLASWAGLVVEERGVPAPAGREVRQLAAFLLGHLDWLAAHPAAGDLAEEVADLVRAAARVVDPDPVRTAEVGSCEQPGCRQPVSVRLGGGGHAPVDRVACAAGHPVPPQRWLRLRHRVAAAHA